MTKAVDFISAPTMALRGDITVPGDKSISHRAIMLGSIAQGTTTINGFLDGEDCLATMNAFRAMGVKIEGPMANRVVVYGVGKNGLKRPEQAIDCGNSGTTIRLISGLLAAQSFNTVLTGDASLTKRPMNRIARPLMQMGADVRTNEGCPPLHIYGGKPLHGITYEMPQASAQVKSCLLLAGMYASGCTQVIEPEPTRDHTERMLKTLSYPVVREGHRVMIQSSFECQGTTIDVPGDFSSAAFFIVASTIVPGSELCIRNVGINTTRTGLLELLNRMGASINVVNVRQYGEEPVADIEVSYAPLHGITFPQEYVAAAIDEFPILFIAAACAKGKTILRGAQELRCKESDRIGVMAAGLQRLGIAADVLDDGIIIEGGVLNGGIIESEHDHRIAMAFSVAGAVAKGPVRIRHCQNVATSFPGFVETASRVNLNLYSGSEL